MTGHETHPENQLALERFKNICNDEQIFLRVIYNEVSVIFIIITNTNYIARKLIENYYYTTLFKIVLIPVFVS